MRIKSGRYTLALTLIAAGFLMLANVVAGNSLFKDLWLYSPVVLVLFGLEAVILGIVYWKRPDTKVSISVGSLVLIGIAVVLFMMWTTDIHIYEPFFRDLDIRFIP